MRLLLVTSRDRSGAWIQELEKLGWTADWISREDFDEASRPEVRIRLAEFVLLDLGDLESGIQAEWERVAGGLPRMPEIVVVKRRFRRHVQAELILLDEDGPERSAELLGLWISSRVRSSRAAERREPPRRGGPDTADAVEEIFSQRQALHDFCEVLVQQDEPVRMMETFMRAVADLHGLARFVLFMRAGGESEVFEPVCSAGIDPDLLHGLVLSSRSGIGRLVCSRHAAIQSDSLESVRDADAEAVREFDALGLDAALPVSDRGRVRGILLIGGRLTGERVPNGQIEFMVRLCERLGSAVGLVEQRRERDAGLAQREDVLEILPFGVTAVAPGGRVLFCNAAGRRILGIPDDAAVHSLRDLPAFVADRIEHGLKTGTPFPATDLKDPVDGRSLRLEVLLREGAGGRIAVTVLVDRAGEKDLERIRREAWREDLLRRFAERTSHELANTLVTLRTFSELLPERYDHPEFRMEFSRIVGDEIARMERFLENVDFLAREPVFSWKRLDMAALLRDVIQEVRNEVGGRTDDGGTTIVRGPAGRPVEIRFDPAPDDWRIDGGEEELKTAFAHLFRNGIQSMARGGRLRISLSRDAGSPGEILAQIRDEGEGILLANLDRIFEPFFTTQHVGAGLGLPIARRIVEAHGGRIEIESTRGRGTTVRVRLPARRPRDADAAPTDAGERIRLPEPDDLRTGRREDS